MLKDYKVIGISSGLGVSLFPFKDHLIANIEPRKIFHDAKDKQWKENFGKIPLYRKMPEEKLSADIIISSPDCGSGSILRYSRSKKLGDHMKNESLSLFFKGIELYRPSFFLFENLEAMFRSFPKDRFREILRNYRLIEHVGSVKYWGNSQINRKRLIIVGIKRTLPQKLNKYFKMPHYESRIMDCEKLYGDLREENIALGHVREPINEIISIHARRKMSLEEIRDEWNGRLKYRKRWFVSNRQAFKFNTAPGVYKNLPDDFPATARKANRQFDSDGLTLSPRQLARIQGIPDEFKIHIEKRELKYWINKGRTLVTKTPPMEISQWFRIKVEKALLVIAN